MEFELTQRQMRLLAYASREEKEAVIGKITVEDALDWDAEFESWAHKAQLPPQQPGWRTWLMLAGRGFGKTRAGAEWIEALARSRPGVRIALVGATIDEARRVMVEGVSGILSVAGRRPRALVTTTPRPIDLLKRIRDGEWTVTTSGRTDENVNLDDKFVEVMVATYGGTRIGRQELDGELI